MVAYPRYYPHKKARIRTFYRHGVEKLHIPWTVEALPALLHISLFLFLAGLSVFLFGVHLTIFKIVTAWIAICVILYACVTFLPIIRKDSPYSAPFSASVSFCLTGIRHLFCSRLLQKLPDIESTIPPLRSNGPGADHLDEFFSYSLNRTAEEYALRLPPNIDHHSLLWTFESLDEDTDLEKFFEDLASLCDSETGKHLNLQQDFIRPHKCRLSKALIGLMDRTLSSNLVIESVKQHRMIICTKAVESTSLLGPWWILRCVLVGDWYRFLECIEFGLFVQNWKSITHPVTSFYAQCVAALTISIVPDRDERWFQLASGLLEETESLLNNYIAHGDSILLANAIFIARRTVQTYSGSAVRHRKELLCSSSRTLETVCNLDIGGTLPELQHQFCGLWNKLVHTARTDERPHHVSAAKTTLKNIRQLYIALHGRCGTPPTAFYTTTDDRVLDDPRLYPMCAIDGHRPSPVPDLQFDEPAPDTDPPPSPHFMPLPTPTFSYPPASQPTFSFFLSSSPAAPYPVAMAPFPVPQLIRPHASSVPSGGNAQSQSQSQPRPLRRSVSLVSSLYLDCESSSSSVLSGGHD
jgi:hypothetical protein